MDLLLLALCILQFDREPLVSLPAVAPSGERAWYERCRANEPWVGRGDVRGGIVWHRGRCVRQVDVQWQRARLKGGRRHIGLGKQ